jgi:hypothetical protein
MAILLFVKLDRFHGAAIRGFTRRVFFPWFRVSFRHRPSQGIVQLEKMWRNLGAQSTIDACIGNSNPHGRSFPFLVKENLLI